MQHHCRPLICLVLLLPHLYILLKLISFQSCRGKYVLSTQVCHLVDEPNRGLMNQHVNGQVCVGRLPKEKKLHQDALCEEGKPAEAVWCSGQYLAGNPSYAFYFDIHYLPKLFMQQCSGWLVHFYEVFSKYVQYVWIE